VSSTLEVKDLQSYRPSQAGILFQHLGPSKFYFTLVTFLVRQEERPLPEYKNVAPAISMFPQDSERENRSVKPNMTVLYIRTFTYLFTCVATDCVFCPGATVEPASPYIGREAWFIATLIGAIGSLIWLAVCILCIFIYRRCRRCGRFNKASNLAGLLSPVRFYNGVELQACSDEMSVVVSFPYFGDNQ